MTNMISFFPENKTSTGKTNFSVSEVLTLSNRHLPDWWSMTLSIFIWMAISYGAAYLVGALVAAISMRKHTYFLPFTIMMSVMCLIGPATVGIITSMVLAFALKSSERAINGVHCCFLGIIQTVFLLVVSWSRLLGTL